MPPRMSSTSAKLRRLAKERFGWTLRDEQLTAMRAVMAGHDLLAVLPTGAGKSAIYQVPALLLDGPTVVVSPLIALQQDQIDGIGVPEAVALNSTLTEAEREKNWQALRDGVAEFVFMAPEQLAKEEVLADLAELGVSLFVVDEAHCVSAWGHDFRPDYLRLAPVVERLGRPRVVALTATAAEPVRRDIVTRLGLRDHEEVIASFDRPNLHLTVVRHTDADQKTADLKARVHELTGPGLVYATSRADTESLADQLAAPGVRTASYHAGMPAGERERVHQDFLAGELDVVVATSAFGMGIDKPDVRFVLHASTPESLDTYYQQIGRAGRDGDPAEVVLMYRQEDVGLQKFLTANKAPDEALEAVVVALKKGEDADLPPKHRTRALNLLEQTGAVSPDLRLTDPAAKTSELVEQAAAVAEQHQQLIRSRIEMMSGYADTTGCRRQYLLGYFGEHLADPCENCDNCDAGTSERRSPGTDEFQVNGRVTHTEWGEGVVMSVDEDRMTVLFDDAGYKTLSLEAVGKQRLLTGA
jgi:ATP-dependent DNA helicase RecQ